MAAARTDEVMGATWGEIDLANRVWTIPAARMKSTRDHRVPLTDSAMATALERVERELLALHNDLHRSVYFPASAASQLKLAG